MRPRRHRTLPALIAIAAFLVVPAHAAAETFIVDNLGDAAVGACESPAPSDCSLRRALMLADQTGEIDAIEFSVAGTIEPATELPQITHPVVLTAATAPGYAGAPVVLIDGTQVSGVETRGLEIMEGAGASRVEGLAIGGFRMGIFAYSETPSFICANYLGVLPDGETALPNEYAGIETAGVGGPGQGIKIGGPGCEGNLISGNTEFGILDAGEGTLIRGNRIGVDADGDPLPNGSEFLVSSGIEVNAAARGPLIGGTGAGQGNVIANNFGPGIRVRTGANKATIRGNSIYADSGGALVFSEGNGTVTTFVEQFAAGSSATLFAGPISGAEANAEYDIDVFASSRCDASSHGPGQVYMGSGTVQTDATGNGHWEFNDGRALAGVDVESLTATATSRATGATSQFSECGHTTPESSYLSTPPLLSNSGSAAFTFTGFDWGHVDHFSCSFEEGLFVTCPTPYEISELGDGQHKLVMRAVDGEAFQNAPGAIYEWTSDTTPPTSSIESGPAAESASPDATFAFSGSDATSGIEGFECRLDGGGFEACASPKQVGGLGEGSHSFAVRSVDKAGNVQSTPTSYSWRVDPKPTPSNGESVAVAPAGGKVYVTRPGGEKVELKEGETIPVGSIVDTTRGRVTLTSASKAGETQTAVFFGGIFLVQQHDGSNLVVLELRGKIGSCKGTARRGGGHPRLARGGRKGRRLWGSGHGKFRTEGNYGSASVRGTIWLTEDRCDGTFFKVRRGIVTIRDFTLKKTLSLPKGRTYLAQP